VGEGPCFDLEIVAISTSEQKSDLFVRRNFLIPVESSALVFSESRLEGVVSIIAVLIVVCHGSLLISEKLPLMFI